MLGVQPLELHEGARLAVGERDGGHPRDGFLQIAVDARDPLADHAVRAAHLPPEEVDRRDDDGEQRETRQREPPVDPQHDRDDARETEHVEHDGHRPSGEHLLQHVDVRGEPRDHAPDRVLVEEAHGEPLDAREERDAQVGEAPLREHHGEVLLAVVRGELGRDHREVHEPERTQAARVVPRDVAVDTDLHQVRLDETEGLLGRRQQQGEPEHLPVRPDEGPEAPDQAGVVRLAELALALQVGRHQMASSSTSSDCCRKRSA